MLTEKEKCILADKIVSEEDVFIILKEFTGTDSFAEVLEICAAKARRWVTDGSPRVHGPIDEEVFQESMAVPYARKKER